MSALLRRVTLVLGMLAVASCMNTTPALPEVTLRVRGLINVMELVPFDQRDQIRVTLYLRRGAVTAIDAGRTDASASDGALNDAGSTDASASDGELSDASIADASTNDAAIADAGTSDGGWNSALEVRSVLPWNRTEPFEATLEVPAEMYTAARVEVSVLLQCGGRIQATILARGVSTAITVASPLVPRDGTMSLVEVDAVAVPADCR